MNLRNQHLLSSLDYWDRAIKTEINKIPLSRSDIPRLPMHDYQKFNETIGYPLHPATLIPNQMMDHQIEYNRLWFEYHRVLYNKSRKVGATDAALRNICEGCYGTYIGHNAMIIAGNRQSQANEFLERFDDLFWGINDKGWTDLNGKVWKHDDLVMNYSSSMMELYSGVKVGTYPATSTALRGPENVKCVFVSEAAHINRLEDKKVYTAVRPIAANDPDCDMVFETTPNGRRGFFYKLWIEMQKLEKAKKKLPYYIYQTDYKVALNKIITPEFIEEERSNPEIDFEQEYCCKFTSTVSSAIDIEALDENFVPMKVNDYSDILGRPDGQ